MSLSLSIYIYIYIYIHIYIYILERERERDIYRLLFPDLQRAVVAEPGDVRQQYDEVVSDGLRYSIV